VSVIESTAGEITKDKATEGGLKVIKFSHKTCRSRAVRWREWVQQLKFSYGTTFPLLSSQMSEACNLQEHWWDLSWHAMYDFDNMSREEDQSFFVSLSKAQFSLLHVLSENFGTHEKQSI
jgi:hypothetical protein